MSPTSHDDEPATIRFGEPDRPTPELPNEPTAVPLGPSSGEPTLSSPGDPTARPNRSRWSRPNRHDGDLADSSERALRAAVAGSSTRASTEAAAANLSPIISTLLQAGGAVVHGRRTPGAQRYLDQSQTATALLWVPTADEAAGVADPLARIAARRLPEGLGEDGDLADVLGATIAAGLFTIGQVIAEQHWRAAHRSMPTAPTAMDPEPPAAEPEPDPAPQAGVGFGAGMAPGGWPGWTPQ